MHTNEWWYFLKNDVDTIEIHMQNHTSLFQIVVYNTTIDQLKIISSN